MQVLRQIIKFVIVGGFNTLVDLAVLNLLIFLTGVASGTPFIFFKAASFLVAVLNSYFWNRRWTFRSDKPAFIQFFAVSTIGLLLNVGAASFLVNILGPQLGLSAKIWANVGAVGGTLVVMTWNFLGYKFVVFKR
jgi:putative flippase GtrA